MSNLPLAGSATSREKRVHSITCERSPGLANPSGEAAVLRATARVIVAALHGRPAAAAPAVHGLQEGGGRSASAGRWEPPCLPPPHPAVSAEQGGS